MVHEYWQPVDGQLCGFSHHFPTLSYFPALGEIKVPQHRHNEDRENYKKTEFQLLHFLRTFSEGDVFCYALLQLYACVLLPLLLFVDSATLCWQDLAEEVCGRACFRRQQRY